MDKYKNSEWLREQYVKLERSAYDISVECDTTNRQITNYLIKFGIRVRSNIEAQYIKTERLLASNDKMYHNKQWLENEFITKHKTAVDIAHDLDCGTSIVQYWISKFKIKRPNKPIANNLPQIRKDPEAEILRFNSVLDLVNSGWREGAIRRILKKKGISGFGANVIKKMIANRLWIDESGIIHEVEVSQ